jgi:hypothetical protein
MHILIHFTLTCFEVLNSILTSHFSVTSYSPASGVLTLEHRLQNSTYSVSALVDVNLVLESLGPDQTRIGEWVNVIGYITAIPPITDGKGSNHGTQRVHAQAILLWSSGPLDVQKYEVSVTAFNHDSRP